VDTFDDVTMTVEQLRCFLEKAQGEPSSLEHCRALIQQFEPARRGTLERSAAANTNPPVGRPF
jgi:hypothetical protein